MSWKMIADYTNSEQHYPTVLLRTNRAMTLAFVLYNVVQLSHCNAIDPLESLEKEIQEIEILLVQKAQEYITHARQLSDVRKRRYQELCRKKLAQLIVTLQEQGIYPAKAPHNYHLSMPLTSAEGYLLAIVDPQEAFTKRIGEAASSWSSNPFLGTQSPCIFVMLPHPGHGTRLATRYLASDGELGSLLAHEIGHLWKFHDHDMSRCMDRWNTHMYLAAGCSAGALIAGIIAFSKRRRPTTEPDNHLEAILNASIAGGIIIASSMALLYAKIKQFSRRQELEADQFVLALGEKGLRSFVMTLARWQLDDQLHEFLDPMTWMCHQLGSIKKTINFIKKRIFGTHPSHAKRLFHLILTWRRMKIQELLTTTSLCTEKDIYKQARDSILSYCLDILANIPELQPKNILTTLAINFPHKILTNKEHKQLELLLFDVHQELMSIIEKALDTPIHS
jgi:hypothetical protein